MHWAHDPMHKMTGRGPGDPRFERVPGVLMLHKGMIGNSR